MTIISNNLNDTRLSAGTLASSLNISSSQLRRIIFCATNMAPSQLIKTFRLERSKNLLAMGVLSVKEVSHSVGINDVSHFVRDFKTKYEMRPSEYRAQSRGQVTLTALL